MVEHGDEHGDGHADAVSPEAAPLLSICVPTYSRPEGLRRALASAIDVPARLAGSIEVVVSDNSEDDRSEQVAAELGSASPVRVGYHRNVPGVGMVGNFNRCVELASGRYVLILHDDDHLLPGAVERMTSWLSRTDRKVILFGVRVVDDTGRVLRRQRVRRVRYLPPQEALRRLLGRSSFVRFPAVVVARAAYERVRPFDADLAGVCDLDMWTRLAGRHGILRVPETTAAYLVHPDADTETVFRPETVARVDEVFDRVRRDARLPADRLARLRTDFLHQFALAGAVRRLRAGDRAGARERFELLSLLGDGAPTVSWRWLPARVLLRIVTRRG